jgi:hypothetical protein
MNRQGYSEPDRINDAVMYHVFADDAVESELLSMFGRVYRITTDPRDNKHVHETRRVEVGADSWPDDLPRADLGVFHPPCSDWSPARTRTGNPTERGNHIPAARAIGRGHCNHYIIENRPESPLKDPVELTGGMFGLPIEHTRAFETSFAVEQPDERDRFGSTTTWWNEFARPNEYWKAVKGYRGEYRKGSLVKSAVPAPYLLYLLREWMEHTSMEPTEPGRTHP